MVVTFVTIQRISRIVKCMAEKTIKNKKDKVDNSHVREKDELTQSYILYAD